MKFWLAIPIVLVLGCPPPKPTPTPTPSPTPTTTPTPTPTPCLPPPSNDPGWKEATTLPSQYKELIQNTQASIGDVCGNEPEKSLDLLGARLRLLGYCAGRLDDAVFIKRTEPTKFWEEHHSVYYGDGCWLSNTYRGTWSYE